MSISSIFAQELLNGELFLFASGDLMIKWSGPARLDDYYTLKALRRQIALVDKQTAPSQKPVHKRNEELADDLVREVQELYTTLKTFGVFSEGPENMKKRVDLMKRIREDLGDVVLCSLKVANSFEIDISQSVHEKIYAVLKESEEPWKK